MMVNLKDTQALSVRVLDCASNKDGIVDNRQRYISNYDDKEYKPPIEYQGLTKNDPIYTKR